MCKVSDKLKLCTCNATNIESLPHYWILYKYSNKEIYFVGEPIFPAAIDPKTDKSNGKTIQALLNQGNCFDFEIALEENDCLEFHFSLKENATAPTPDESNDYLAYSFSFKNGQWVQVNYDPFRNNLDAKLKGKIEKPF